MDDVMMDDHDDQTITYLLLEHIVCFNMKALEHLRNGEEIAAVVVLTEALALLAIIAQDASISWEAQPEEANSIFPNTLTMFDLPSVQPSNHQQQVPRFAIAINTNGTFSLIQGLGSAQRILTALTLYHTALAIHRGCSRLDGINRVEITRCRDLYQACEDSLTQVPELKSIKHKLEASIGYFYGMFDCPAAA
jgi:hypothetical protein